LLEQKETKIQERTPTSIFFRAHSARTPEKIAVRTVRSHPRAFLSGIYKREVLALCNRRFITHLYLTRAWWTSDL